LLKHSSPKISTDDGITIHANPLPENAFASIRTNFDRDSNVIDESDVQEEKQRSPSVSTDDGITRSVNPLQENADASIRTNFDNDSNVIDESAVQ
jgi:hypothetical protein